MSSTLNSATVIALLKIQNAGIDQSIEVRDGDRFFVGSDERSDICVDATNVAPTHCLIAAKFGSLTIEDCYSPAGTIVSDQKIRSLQLTGNADIRLGDAVIKVRFPNVPGQPGSLHDALPEMQPTVVKTPELRPASEPQRQATVSEGLITSNSGASDVLNPAVTVHRPLHADHAPSSLQETDLTATADPEAAMAELRWKIVQLEEENRSLEQQLGKLSQAGFQDHADTDPFHEEMLELLRAEVIELQSALAERDASSRNTVTGNVMAASLSPASSNTRNPDEYNSARAVGNFGGDAYLSGTGEVLEGEVPKTEDAADLNERLSVQQSQQLLDRLENMLNELQQKDEQVATLTDLLEAAEETNRLERDERGQLNNWLQDIEQRFGSREQEWQAERAELNKQLQLITAERDRAENTVKADSASGKLQAAQNLLQALRVTADDQRRQLQESEATIAELQHRLKQAQELRPREERIELAELKSEIARQRQEIESLRMQGQRGSIDDADLKLRALRQHLNEIHQEEKIRRAELEEQNKLSNRLSRLWRRMEGR